MKWIQSNYWEIKQSRSLAILGVFFAFFHVTTALQWFSADFAQREFAPCWDALPSCQGWQDLLSLQFSHIVKVYGVLAVLALLVFSSRKIVYVAWWLLLVSSSIKLVVYLTYAELADNMHSFLFIIEFCFLFILQKKRTIKALIISMYLVSGILKLNSDWLAGFWLAPQLDELPVKAIEWIAAILVIVELTVPLGLVSRVQKRFALSVLILFIYHGLYWLYISPTVGAIQIGWLIFLLVDFYEVRKKSREYTYQPSYVRHEPSQCWPLMALTLFWALQFLPVWDQTVISESFPLRLKSYKVLMSCKQYNFINFKQSLIDVGQVKVMDSCHPTMHFYQSKALCDKYSSENDFIGVSSYFVTKELSDPNYTSRFEFRNICLENSVTKGEP